MSKHKKNKHRVEQSQPDGLAHQSAVAQSVAQNLHNIWLIEPRDTLILRDGRPASGGIAMGCLPFPWPSSVAGLARTQCGSNANGFFTLDIAEAKAIDVKGPWLCELDGQGAVIQHFFPAPLDCVWMYNQDCQKSYSLYGLSPNLDHNFVGNMPDGLKPVFPQRKEGLPEEKSLKAPPAFWSIQEYANWLTNSCRAEEHFSTLPGIPALDKEIRCHVSIDRETGAAEEGQLFSTESLRFSKKSKDYRQFCRFALALACDDKRMHRGNIVLGGKGRISSLRKAPPLELNFLEDILFSQNINSQKYVFRVILLTPALFANGYLPQDKKIDGATITAVCCGRGLFISGWDMENNRPKKARRMVPAGSVYWVEFTSRDEANMWARNHWMKCISDNEQDKKDGFGLCILGRE